MVNFPGDELWPWLRLQGPADPANPEVGLANWRPANTNEVAGAPPTALQTELHGSALPLEPGQQPPGFPMAADGSFAVPHEAQPSWSRFLQDSQAFADPWEPGPTWLRVE